MFLLLISFEFGCVVVQSECFVSHLVSADEFFLTGSFLCLQISSYRYLNVLAILVQY